MPTHSNVLQRKRGKMEKKAQSQVYRQEQWLSGDENGPSSDEEEAAAGDLYSIDLEQPSLLAPVATR